MLSQSTHMAKLQQILSTLWLKRSADTSTFFGKPLTEPIPNRHHIVECPLPAKYLEMVNKSAENVSAELRDEHQTALARWNTSLKLKEQPKINVSLWLGRVRRTRILSS